MFILNKKTKMIQECHNKDVIKICQKDTAVYQVAAVREALEAPSASEEAAGEATDISGMNLTELRTLAKEKGLSGYTSLSKEELAAVLKDVV